MLYRHYYLHFLGPSAPSGINFRMSGHVSHRFLTMVSFPMVFILFSSQPISVNEDGQTPYNEILLSVCFPGVLDLIEI